jgi:death-on-curing protein
VRIFELHRLIVETSGGATGIRDLAALESAVAQPKMTFYATDLFPSLLEKAAVLCFSIVQGHPFIETF